MAALQLSLWKNWLKTTGQMSMARDRCSRDSIARWNQTWILSTLKLHWIVCWKNGVVRDIPRAEGAGMKHLTTRWEKTWRKRNNEWEYKVRFVGREYRWQEFREDLFAPGASYCTGRIVDIFSLKRRVPTFTLDCTDAYHQAPEQDDVVVEPPEEYLNRLRAAGMSTDIWWKLQKQLPGRRQAGQRWVDHFTSALVDKLGFTRCVSAPQFFWNPDRQVGMEVHMDDVHGFGPDPQVEKFKGNFAAHIWFRDGGVHHEGAEYDHLKRFRKRLNGAMTIESNPKGKTDSRIDDCSETRDTLLEGNETLCQQT